MTAENVIEVEGLAKRFDQVEAVKGIAFSVRSGEIFGFLGPNGAGKTTTIKMLCTLLPPSAGAARLAGKDVVKESAEVRRAIGIIFQDPSLDDRLTATENLRLHAVAYRVPRPERAARIDEVLTFVELLDRKNDVVRTFSGGMKRRLEIARGLLHRPQVLFLDEPTIGLDPQTRRKTWDVLRALREKYGTTLFLTTHYMDEAEYCDRIAIIDHGKIVALDTPETLKRGVGKDRVEVRSTQPDALIQVLKDKYALEATKTPEGIRFGVENGEAFIVKLLTEDKLPLQGIGVHRPTLDDVFLSLTGREIRAEGAQGFSGIARAVMMRRGR
jgi:ABC-2 type transport system ATP-binding protein